MLLRAPGVYRAEGDTEVLADVMRDEGLASGRTVLDVGTGSGALALAAAGAGARAVTAVDLSLRSVVATWLNGRLRRVPLTVRRGDLFAPVAGRRFDLVVANPPYVPAATAVLPRHRKARCWDGGLDGRALVDRICTGVGGMLTEGGHLLMVHSALCGTEATLDALTAAGLEARLVVRTSVPFGPVLRGRRAMLEERGLIAPGQEIEELVVVGARRG